MNLSTLRFLRSPPRCLPGSGRQQFPQLRRAQIAVVLLGEENVFLGGAFGMTKGWGGMHGMPKSQERSLKRGTVRLSQTCFFKCLA